MNLQQLEYIVALDTHRQFVIAAQKCFVTQATLSMMIKKLEDEMGVKIFDRRRQPVIPTETGVKIIAQAKRVLYQVDRLQEVVREEQNLMEGDLRMGIIPTLAPYLLPLFMNAFLRRYPKIRLKVAELTTEDIVRKLQHHDLDVGLLAIPLHQPELIEFPLFYEQFVVYTSSAEKIMQKKFVLARDIDVNRLWLLEEGHCLRSQVINLCELKKREKETHQLDFAAGSIETLKRIVETNQGMTILPQLALRDMTARQKQHIRYFKKPAPVREIGLVTYRYYVKEKLVSALREEILLHIPAELKSTKSKEVVDIQPYKNAHDMGPARSG